MVAAAFLVVAQLIRQNTRTLPRRVPYRVHMTNPNPKTLTLNPFPFRELTVRLDRARAYLSVPFTHHLLCSRWWRGLGSARTDQARSRAARLNSGGVALSAHFGVGLSARAIVVAPPSPSRFARTWC